MLDNDPPERISPEAQKFREDIVKEDTDDKKEKTSRGGSTNDREPLKKIGEKIKNYNKRDRIKEIREKKKAQLSDRKKDIETLSDRLRRHNREKTKE
ncbi:hypothetical protein ACMXYO_14235 [Neptuniibacter sp. QD37_6]|uniref:hypothetical protein n=1 Tax=Neptuniibacter sp. QD37_6 TaxID=3398210 RepID=UPI0039F4BECB